MEKKKKKLFLQSHQMDLNRKYMYNFLNFSDIPTITYVLVLSSRPRKLRTYYIGFFLTFKVISAKKKTKLNIQIEERFIYVNGF